MVSYSVIVGSSAMTFSQPAMMIFRTWASENWILEVPSLSLMVEVVPLVLFVSVFKGRGCAYKKIMGMGQSEMVQPRARAW